MHRRRVALAGHVAQERGHRRRSPATRRRRSANGNRAVASRSSAARVRGGVDAERADDPQLLVDDEVGVEARHVGAMPRVPATTIVPPVRASRIACTNAAGALAVTSTTTSASAAGRGSRSASTGSRCARRRRRDRRRSRGGSRDGARRARRGRSPSRIRRRRASRPRTPTGRGRPGRAPPRSSPGCGLRHGDPPADARAERIEQRRGHRVELGRHREQHRVGREVLVLGVAAPQSRAHGPRGRIRTCRARPCARSAGTHRRGTPRTRDTTGRPRPRRGRRRAHPTVAAARVPTRSTTPTDSCPGTNAKPGNSSPVYSS